MNLPNKITLLRVCLIPAFLFVYLAQPFYAIGGEAGAITGQTLGEILNDWFALTLFVIAAVTDAIDGHLARKLGLVTNFGKLTDPLADKLLVCSAFVAFTATNSAIFGGMPAWATIILIAREFYISGLRQLALEQNIVVAASTTAKIKTAAQITLVVFFLLPFPISYLAHDAVILGLIIITTIISVYSAWEYTLKNKALFAKDFG